MKRTTPTQKKKGQRGLGSHGWGHKKKHRGAGSRGGKGNAGTGKRADTKKPTVINKLGTPNFARRGFVVPDKKTYEAINLKDLTALYEKGKIKNTVNLHELGYEKLLASGTLVAPLQITVAMASHSAIEKVKNAGGQVILTAQDSEESEE